LVSVRLRLPGNGAKTVSVLLAVSDKLNNNLILTAPVVQALLSSACEIQSHNASNSPLGTLLINTCDEELNSPDHRDNTQAATLVSSNTSSTNTPQS
jgi:hypothetical protein